MNDYLSLKIRNLSAISILMVVYIHMYYTEGLSLPLLGGIERFIGGSLCTIAVPLFYLISGYLFFLKVPNGLHSIGKKLKKRCHTLLIPYIIANTLTFVFYITLSMLAMRVPSIDNVVNFNVLNLIDTLGVGGVLKFVFIDPPVAFQLWFVRDLMVVMLLSPVIYLIF